MNKSVCDSGITGMSTECAVPKMTTKPKRRSFGGKTDNFESKEEKAFEKAHLKAYLSGKVNFDYGYETITTTVLGVVRTHRQRKTHQVKAIWS